LNSATSLYRGVRRVVIAQAVLTVLTAAGFAASNGWPQAFAALYGGGVTVLISAWQGWRLQRMSARHRQSAGGALVGVYVGAIQRYAAVFVLLGFGLAVWRLAPLPLVAAFAVAQFGYLAGSTGR